MDSEHIELSETEKELLGLLREHPELAEPVRRIVKLANKDGAGAHRVEDELIEEVRRLGSKTMSSWAQRQARRVEEEMEGRSPPMHRHKKKG
jgi:Zn-dependent M32 family carboxypeptidase